MAAYAKARHHARRKETADVSVDRKEQALNQEVAYSLGYIQAWIEARAGHSDLSPSTLAFRVGKELVAASRRI